jgi:hypothetical protein
MFRLVLAVPTVFALLNVLLAIVALAEGPCLPSDQGGC